MLLGRVVNKGYTSRDLAACICTTSGFHAAFQFRGFGSTVYMGIMYSISLTSADTEAASQIRPCLLQLQTLLLNKLQNSEYGVSCHCVNVPSNDKTITVTKQEESTGRL